MSENLRRAASILIEKLLAAAPDKKLERPCTIRVEAPVKATGLLDWLRAQTNESKLFWADRENAFSVAGLGTTNVLEAETAPEYTQVFAAIREDLDPAYPSMRYYGGFHFGGPLESEGPWSAIPAYRLVLPTVELGHKEALYSLACNARFDPGKALQPQLDKYTDAIGNLCHSYEAPATAPLSPDSRVDSPDQEQWSHLVQGALDRMKMQSLEKVVLARQTEFEFPETLDPLSILQRLTENTTYSYRFLIQFSPSRVFLGASPERLYKRQSNYVQSEALAGTRPRGAGPSEDESIATELLQSDKELREHRFVLDRIRSVFQKHCAVMRPDGNVHVLKLRHCQHLLTRIEGVLKEKEADGVILQELHPTPAVGGSPTEAALALINESEPFSRGWWAGPVGWVAADSVEFAVAIRSGLVEGARLTIWSGAGIVSGSQADQEWDELENKMSNFLNALDSSQPISRSEKAS